MTFTTYLKYGGVIVPLLVIAFIVVVAVFDVGMSTNVSTVPFLRLSQLFVGRETCPSYGSQLQAVTLQTFTISNNFIVPRSKTLSTPTVCLYPYHSYSDRLYTTVSSTEYSLEGARVVNIGAFSKAQVSFSITPVCNVQSIYNETLRQYTSIYIEPSSDYKEVLIIQPPKGKDYYYADCASISESDRVAAAHIPVINDLAASGSASPVPPPSPPFVKPPQLID